MTMTSLTAYIYSKH